MAEEIRAIRGALTQEEFAHALGCSVRSVQLWEKGKVVPGRHQLVRIRKRQAEPAARVPLSPDLPPSAEPLESGDRELAHVAVEVLFDYAPSEMIKSVVDFLVNKAGTYAILRSPKVGRDVPAKIKRGP